MHRAPVKVINDAGRHRRLRALLQSTLADTPIKLREVDRSCIWDSALLHYHWLREQGVADPWEDTKAFRHHLSINFLRHEASNYDKVLDRISALQIDSRSKYLLARLLKEAVLDLIAARYPEYREACRLQAREARSRTNPYRKAAA